jgi:hypothetical protein
MIAHITEGDVPSSWREKMDGSSQNKCYLPTVRPALSGLLRCAFLAVLGTSLGLGCGGPHAVLNFTTPSTATAGSGITVTVTVTIDGRRDTLINSSIHFTSSDLAAILPIDYTFTPADAGSHTWTNGVVFMTPGRQKISGSIYDAAGISGTAVVTVSP